MYMSMSLSHNHDCVKENMNWKIEWRITENGVKQNCKNWNIKSGTNGFTILMEWIDPKAIMEMKALHMPSLYAKHIKRHPPTDTWTEQKMNTKRHSFDFHPIWLCQTLTALFNFKTESTPNDEIQLLCWVIFDLHFLFHSVPVTIIQIVRCQQQ